MMAGASVISVGASLATAASCGTNGSATSGGDAARAEDFAFAGSWTFASATPVSSCQGPALEATDLAGHKITIAASGSHAIVYEDNGCSISLSVNGSSAMTGGATTVCPTGPSGLVASIRSLELRAQGADTVSTRIEGQIKGQIKGGLGVYDCVSTVTGELHRSPP